MKPPAVLATFLCGSVSVMLAQTEPSGSIEDQAAATGTPDRLEVVSGSLDPTAVRFTPPPPPKTLPPIPVEASAVIQKPTHTITLVRGAPSTLPDIPPPPPPVERPATFTFPPQHPSFIVGFSVTIYDGWLSHVEWRDPQTKEQFEAWCGWDWNLLAPMQEVSCNRVTYHLFFSPWNIDTTQVHPVFGQRTVPEHPEVAADQFVLVEGTAVESDAGSPLLEAIQRYCVANRSGLEAMRAAREQYRLDAEAWKKANPEKPRDYTIVLRPHRGSRYLKGREPVADTEKTSTEEGAQ